MKTAGDFLDVYRLLRDAMTRRSLNRVWAAGLLLSFGAGVAAPSVAGAQSEQTVQTGQTGQIDQNAEAQLLGKARALDMRGRVDLAKQVWRQVLNSDPNQPEALAGMARASKLEGNSKEAQEYLNKLRAVSPNDPNIQRIETTGTSQDETSKLQEAARLSQAGQSARAMNLLREVYGSNPPPGDAALSYYQTEGGSEEGRPQAIAGLRALADKYPQDARYQIALGKILTYNPRTRAEGRKLLAKHPYDPEAQAAMRQSLVWDQPGQGAGKGVMPSTQAYSVGQSAEVQVPVAVPVTHARRVRSRASSTIGAYGSKSEQRQARAALRSRNAEQRAAYRALNAKRMAEAETRFKALLDRNPRDFQSAAGLGYVRMSQFNFAAAISYFEQAEQAGDHDPAIGRSLRDSRFYFTMQTATAALNENRLAVAEQEFRAALEMRHDDPAALQGLGGTLLKAQQNERAAEVFTTLVRVAPGEAAGWRGLFMAEAGSSRYSEALNIDRRVPPKVKAGLVRDHDYLRTLAGVYIGLGRDAEAQRVLQNALQLPFPGNGAGQKADVELQYAALLSAAGRKEQALTLYKQVLAQEPKNVNAWIGLVLSEHLLGQDAVAYEAIHTMPAPSYEGAMHEAGFETTVAAVYEGQGHDELAQQILEQFLAAEKAQGKQPFAPAEIQLASIYMRRGNSARAYAMYRSLLEANPNNADAWTGLLGALHTSGHDTEALAQVEAIPPDVRRNLENNPAYLQAVGAIYASLGDSQAALQFFNRLQQHYAEQHTQPSADLEVQEAWLLYNSHSDQALLSELLTLGDRKDLTDAQRLTVQTIWANFAVRRANQASAAGNERMALAILNAAAQSFGNNPDVLRALAGGYASAGMPKEAVAIFKAQDLSTGTAADYRGAVGAALAANDLRDAEMWLRFGLDRYPRDSQMMILAARFEGIRGDPNRAALYYKAALAAMPAANPGAQLASEMSRPAPQAGMNLPTRRQSQNLAALLAAPDRGGDFGQQQPMEIRPYLPSYTGGTGTLPVPPEQTLYGSGGFSAGVAYGSSLPVRDEGAAGAASGPRSGMGLGLVPGGMGTNGIGGPDLGGFPALSPQGKRPAGTGAESGPSGGSTTLKEAKPHTRLEPLRAPASAVQLAANTRVIHLHADRATEATYGPYIAYDPSANVPHFVGTRTGLGDGVVMAAGMNAPGATAKIAGALMIVRADEHAALHIVHFHAASAEPGQAAPLFSPRPKPATRTTAADGTPIVPYAATARPVTRAAARRRFITRTPQRSSVSLHRGQQAAARRQQAVTSLEVIRESSGDIQTAAAPAITGVSRPPVETYPNPPAAALSEAQYNAGSPAPTGQVLPPRNAGTQGGYSTSGQVPAAAPYGQQPTYEQQPYGDSSGQQYPQPGTRGTSGGNRPVKRRSGGNKAEPAAIEPAGTPAGSQQPAYQQPGMQYPASGQPLDNPGLPQNGAPYSLGQAPSDYQLQQHNLPPLRGYWDPRADMRRPLSERAQAEFDLAQIEGSYSSWLGGSVIGRYRSGTPGIDRLAALTVPVEASFVVDNSFRLSIIPKAVFLNSGTLNTNGGTLATGPVLGTYLGTAPNNPAQQFASGIGGEVQLATNTFAVAVGTTPFQFLVTNLIGRGQWRPGNSHFTLYGGRDAVEETQLSYAGLRDPGTATPTYGGNVWGGVVATGGGARLDYGDEHAGFYAAGEGAVLTGYHVLQNQKADGTLGAYFRVKQWPEYGTLNIGGTFYGAHFTYNERGETYGLGGYFSPEAYFLAAVPLTYTGHYGTDLHYTINGSLGVQTFQEDNQSYFPLDPGLLAVAGCTNAQLINRACGLPVNSNTGLNFSFNSQVAYRVNEHWFVGAFLSANNTNNYDTVTGGFYARYTFRPQYQSTEYPTGLFPVQGFRPLRVP